MFINLLIALTVGDISRIQEDAIITRLSVEMNAIISLDVKCLPHCCAVYPNVKHYRKYPNKITCISVLNKIFNKWFTSKSGVYDTDEDSNEDFQTILKEEFAEYKEQCFSKLHQRLTSNESSQSDKLKQLENLFEVKDEAF